MLAILFLLVNTIILTPVLDRTYKIIDETKILYLTSWNHSQTDVAFANTMQYLSSCT